MRFVAGYYLAQSPLKDRRASRGAATSSRQTRQARLRLPISGWLAAFRPAGGTAGSSQPAQIAPATRNAS
jgi:hypothetical protein